MGKFLRDELYKIIETESQKSSQYLIAKEILNRLNVEGDLSVNAVAASSFSSRPTVVRFAQNLGFEGFKEFRKELLEQDATYYFKSTIKTYEESFNGYLTLLHKVFRDINQSEQTIIDVAELIYKKRRLFIFASGENVWLGNMFADRLRFLGIETFNAMYLDKQVFLLNHLHEDDLVIFLVSGFDLTSLTQMWEKIYKFVTTVLISVETKKDKFPNPDFSLILSPPINPARVVFKQHEFYYILDQIFILLLFHDQAFLKKITDPTYKF